MSGTRIITSSAERKIEDPPYVKGLIEAGKLNMLIDWSFPPRQMADVHGYVDTGQKIDNVVITVD